MARPTKPLYAGLRTWYETPHGTIGVYDGILADLDTAAGRWQTICEKHGTIISHATLKTAKLFAQVPQDWCDREPLPLLSEVSDPDLFVARFKHAVGRYLVSTDGYSYQGRRILDRRQLAHGNLPDSRTGLWLNESFRIFAISDIVNIKRAPRVLRAV